MEVIYLFIKSLTSHKRGMRVFYKCLTVVGITLVVLIIFNTISAFIRPGDALGVKTDLPSDQFGYYCTYSALHSAHDGKPVPSICSLTLVNEVAAASTPKIVKYDGDKYAWGNCTYWAALRRFQVGNPIPNTWGDATYWAGRARMDGYTVDHNPTPGSIMQRSSGLGHVAFVENIESNGTWHISEMNVKGFNEVDYRSMSPSAAATYYFIH